jgi:hypothetical protein
MKWTSVPVLMQDIIYAENFIAPEISVNSKYSREYQLLFANYRLLTTNMKYLLASYNSPIKMKKLILYQFAHWINCLIILCIGFIVTSCVDLGAVRNFAKSSSATADYKAIAEDYISSPERRKAFQASDRHPALDADKRERETQMHDLAAAQKVIAEYMSALGDMAADDLPSADKEIESLRTATVATFPKLDATAAKSVSEIATIITNAVLNHWRKKKVKEIIKKTNQPLQNVISGMNKIADAMSLSLDVNDTATDQFFNNPFFGVPTGASLNANQKRFVDIVKSDYLKEQQGHQRLKTYKDALEKISNGHNYLTANLDKLNDDLVKKELNQYAKDLRSAYKAFTELK